jgi:hypothetical protein
MTALKVGDFVVSDRNPTCVQRVVKVEPMVISGKECPGYDPMVTCVTVWRLDGKPLSGKALKAAAAWSYKKANKALLTVAVDRLMTIIQEMP